MPMITFYIYSNVLPKRELILYRCLKCSRPLLKASNEIMVITNAATPGFETSQTAKGFAEIKCHSCKMEYRICWQ